MISAIVAASDNNVIGIENGLPWSLPNDMKFFKNTTWGFPVIMGRKTFESMGGLQGLKGRQNIVITRQKDYKCGEGVIVVSSIEEAIKEAEKLDTKEIFIAGGSEIFVQSMPLQDRIYITRVHADIEGDAFFPVFNKHEEWELVSSDAHRADDRHAYDYTFETWDRRK